MFAVFLTIKKLKTEMRTKFRKQRRFVKLEEPKTYIDNVSGMIIYERLSAADFGVAEWNVCRNENMSVEFQGNFLSCKKFLTTKFPD